MVFDPISLLHLQNPIPHPRHHHDYHPFYHPVLDQHLPSPLLYLISGHGPPLHLTRPNF